MENIDYRIDNTERTGYPGGEADLTGDLPYNDREEYDASEKQFHGGELG